MNDKETQKAINDVWAAFEQARAMSMSALPTRVAMHPNTYATILKAYNSPIARLRRALTFWRRDK